MKNEYSLVTILRNDPDFAKQLAKTKEAVKKDKQTLLKASESVSEKYQSEISEGTKLRQKLLTDGRAHGLSEDEVLSQHGRFVPSIYTPILNLLFFMFREDAQQVNNQMRLEELTQHYIKQFGYEEFIRKLETNSTFVREQYGDDFEDVVGEDTKDPQEMETFIYGNMSHDTFKKIKKLKALSHSTNEKEAFSAYRKCLELCKKYNLEFDKIPCAVRG
jgi:hypothetical protein